LIAAEAASLIDVDGVRVETYLDTSGVSLIEYQGMIGLFDRLKNTRRDRK
jgi:hypothetical protein